MGTSFFNYIGVHKNNGQVLMKNLGRDFLYNSKYTLVIQIDLANHFLNYNNLYELAI